jgi:hypothetical protein
MVGVIQPRPACKDGRKTKGRDGGLPLPLFPSGTKWGRGDMTSGDTVVMSPIIEGIKAGYRGNQLFTVNAFISTGGSASLVHPMKTSAAGMLASDYLSLVNFQKKSGSVFDLDIHLTLL